MKQQQTVEKKGRNCKKTHEWILSIFRPKSFAKKFGDFLTRVAACFDVFHVRNDKNQQRLVKLPKVSFAMTTDTPWKQTNCLRHDDKHLISESRESFGWFINAPRSSPFSPSKLHSHLRPKVINRNWCELEWKIEIELKSGRGEFLASLQVWERRRSLRNYLKMFRSSLFNPFKKFRGKWVMRSFTFSSIDAHVMVKFVDAKPGDGKSPNLHSTTTKFHFMNFSFSSLQFYAQLSEIFARAEIELRD